MQVDVLNTEKLFQPKGSRHKSLSTEIVTSFIRKLKQKLRTEQTLTDWHLKKSHSEQHCDKS